MKEIGLNNCVSIYRELLKAGDIQIAYAGLVKYVQKLRTVFSKEFGNEYSVGNILQGYMDYTYFYLANDPLTRKKLKFGLVLNHTEANFELWLLGQTKDVQEKYWRILKNTKWVKTSDMPRYSVFELTLLKNPDFEDLDKLTDELIRNFMAVSNEILATLNEVA